MLPLARPMLYESWTRLNWPKVESVAGEIDVAHATGLVPCGTAAPLVVTVHDLAFVHDPAKFSAQGVRTMNRSLAAIIRRADRVICSSEATRIDCEAAGIDPDRLRLVPLGVDIVAVSDADIERVRRRYLLPDEFVLFVGTRRAAEEPRPARRSDAAPGHARPARGGRRRWLGRRRCGRPRQHAVPRVHPRCRSGAAVRRSNGVRLPERTRRVRSSRRRGDGAGRRGGHQLGNIDRGGRRRRRRARRSVRRRRHRPRRRRGRRSTCSNSMRWLAREPAT